MSTSLKKLLLVSITLFLGVMSVGVAQAGLDLTYYNFDYTVTANGTGSVVGIFGVDSSGVIQSITGRISGSRLWWHDGAISGLLPTGSIGDNDNLYSPTSRFLPGNGVSFYTGKYSGDPFTAENDFYLWYGGAMSSDHYVIYAGPILMNGDGGYITGGQLNSSLCTINCPGGGGAPEIDGSLAPKVGFLLGCLFLMFGRKKQNSEPMLTA